MNLRLTSLFYYLTTASIIPALEKLKKTTLLFHRGQIKCLSDLVSGTGSTDLVRQIFSASTQINHVWGCWSVLMDRVSTSSPMLVLFLVPMPHNNLNCTVPPLLPPWVNNLLLGFTVIKQRFVFLTPGHESQHLCPGLRLCPLKDQPYDCGVISKFNNAGVVQRSHTVKGKQGAEQRTQNTALGSLCLTCCFAAVR